MATSRAELAYLQARLQARHGARPDETLWRSLEASRELGHAIETARASPLRPWVQHLTPRADSHALERSLRRDWRAYGEQVASWCPPRWRAALRWAAAGVDLPALAHCLREREPPAWLREDEALAPFALEEPAERVAALSRSQWAPLVEGWRAGAGLPQAWMVHWRALWPEQHRRIRGPLERLAALLREHLRRMAAPGPDARAGVRLRAELEAGLTRLFRRHPQHPVAPFCHLGLVALDVERLRGHLVRLALFGDAGAGA